MKKIFNGIVTFLLILYLIGFSFSAMYFNWQYAKKHGFMRWLILGEVVSTAEAFAWPYFLVAEAVKYKNVDGYKIDESLLQKLKVFMLKDAITITLLSRSDAQNYLKSKEFKPVMSYKHKQEDATEDIYILKNATKESPVNTVSLVSFGGTERVSLFIVSIPIKLNYLAEQYIKKAIETKDVEGGKLFKHSKLYFLGIYRLGPSRVIKISIREDTITAKIKKYSVCYASSDE